MGGEAVDAREELLDILEDSKERTENLFFERPVGQEQLDVLLACIDLGRLELLHSFLELLKERWASGTQEWSIPPGVIERTVNERLVRASGRTDKLYRCCGVRFPGFDGCYTYLTDDLTLRAGDEILAPFGRENTAMIGRIEHCRDYTADSTPYPLEKLKYILGPSERP